MIEGMTSEWVKLVLRNGDLMGRIVSLSTIGGREAVRLESLGRYEANEVRHVFMDEIVFLIEMSEQEVCNRLKALFSGKCPCPACVAKAKETR